MPVIEIILAVGFNLFKLKNYRMTNNKQLKVENIGF
jgi:hypothetical protein